MRERLGLLALALVAAAMVAGGSRSVEATSAVFTVTKVADTSDGTCDIDCSLREAVAAANATVDKDTINFAIGTGQQTIALASVISITQPVDINGLTQPGGPACSPRNLMITVTAAGAAISVNGPAVAGPATTIQGLAMTGITLLGNAGPVTLRCNNIGANATGTASLGASGNCVAVGTTNAPVKIGGNAIDDFNVISGCAQSGISGTGGTGHTIQGNIIGLKSPGAAGVPALKNGVHGITISGGTGWQIKANVVSGNGDASTEHGINLTGGATTATLQSNRVGTNAAGTSAVPNFGNGITVTGAQVTIGGAGPGLGNVIAGNGGPGVNSLNGHGVVVTADNAVIQGNYIGFDVTGSGALSNARNALVLTGSNITVGGTALFASNFLHSSTNIALLIQASTTAISNIDVLANYLNMAGNLTVPANAGLALEVITSGSGTVNDVDVGDGTVSGANVLRSNRQTPVVFMQGSVSGVSLMRNSILGTQSFGIDLVGPSDFPDRSTANDPGDADSGPNGLQNYPILDPAPASGSLITGDLDAKANTTYRIEFYRNTTTTGFNTCDAEGAGDGEEFASTTDVTTDANGHADIAWSLGITLNPGEAISATATDPDGNTSEFGPCTWVPGGPVSTDGLSLDGMVAGSNPFTLSFFGGGFTEANGVTWNGSPLQRTIFSPVEIRLPISEGILGNAKATISLQLTTNGTPTGGPLEFRVYRSSSDVDCDGDGDAVDSLRVLQILAGLALPDVNCQSDAALDDGETTLIDAIHIRADLVGLVEPYVSNYDE